MITHYTKEQLELACKYLSEGVSHRQVALRIGADRGSLLKNVKEYKEKGDAAFKPRKSASITKEGLSELSKTHYMREVEAMYGVSHGALANLCRKWNISFRKRNEAHWGVKISDEDLELAKRLFFNWGIKQETIANMFGITQAYFSQCVSGRARIYYDEE